MLCAEVVISIFSSIPRQHSNLSITPQRPLRLWSFSPNFSGMHLEGRGTRRSITMKMNPLVPSPPRRDLRAHGYRQGTEPTNETAACAVPLKRREKRYLRWSQNEIFSRCVAVPHDFLPNPETITEQNRHLMMSISPRAQSAP